MFRLGSGIINSVKGVGVSQVDISENIWTLNGCFFFFNNLCDLACEETELLPGIVYVKTKEACTL